MMPSIINQLNIYCSSCRYAFLKIPSFGLDRYESPPLRGCGCGKDKWMHQTVKYYKHFYQLMYLSFYAIPRLYPPFCSYISVFQRQIFRFHWWNLRVMQNILILTWKLQSSLEVICLSSIVFIYIQNKMF